MCTLELSKVLVIISIMITLKTDIATTLLFTGTDSLMMKLQQKMSMKIFVTRKCLTLGIIQLGQNSMILQTKKKWLV